MRVVVGQAVVLVPVRVRLSHRDWVHVLMMLIVDVQMIVIELVVRVPVLVARS